MFNMGKKRQGYNDLKKQLEKFGDLLKSQDIEIPKELDSIRQEVTNMIIGFRNSMEKRLVDFEKDMLDKVTKNYLQIIEYILKWNQNFGLLERIVQDKGQFSEFNKDLMYPFLRDKWSIQDKKNSDKIDLNIKTKGDAILKKYKELCDSRIKLVREEKDTSLVDSQLHILKFILEVE